MGWAQRLMDTLKNIRFTLFKCKCDPALAEYIGVTERGKYKYQCPKCYKISERSEMLCLMI